jgi:hypothetical protein
MPAGKTFYYHIFPYGRQASVGKQLPGVSQLRKGQSQNSDPRANSDQVVTVTPSFTKAFLQGVVLKRQNQERKKCKGRTFQEAKRKD